MKKSIQVGDVVNVRHLQGTEKGLVDSFSGSEFDFPKVTVQFNQDGMISYCTFNLNQVEAA